MADVMAFTTRTAPDPSPSPAQGRKPTEPAAPNAASGWTAPTAIVRRPGAVGGVTVRAPMLDPARSAAAHGRVDGGVAQVRARSHRAAAGRETATHPKLVDRQRAIRRAERTARLRPFLVPAVVVALLVVGAVTVLFSPLFAVRSVVLRFDGPAAEQNEIARIIGPMRNQNLIRVDVGARESVLRSLPWVASASVRRSFPRSVEVRVTAHDVAGLVRLPDGGSALVSTGGAVLDIVDADNASIAMLPVFDLGLTATPDADDALAEPAPAVLSSAAALNRRLPGRLQLVTIRDGQVEWTLRPIGDNAAVRVLVGRAKDSDVPAAALASVLGRPGPSPTVIDLRTPATPVLTFADKS